MFLMCITTQQRGTTISETCLSSYPYGWFHGIFHLQFFAFRIEASASPLPQSLACHLLIPRLITALLWFLKLKIEEIYVINIEVKYTQTSLFIIDF